MSSEGAPFGLPGENADTAGMPDYDAEIRRSEAASTPRVAQLPGRPRDWTPMHLHRVIDSPGLPRDWTPMHFYRFGDLPAAWQAGPDHVQMRQAERSLQLPIGSVEAFTCLSLPDFLWAWGYREDAQSISDAEGVLPRANGSPEDAVSGCNPLLPICIESLALWVDSYGDDRLRAVAAWYSSGCQGPPPQNLAVVWGSRS